MTRWYHCPCGGAWAGLEDGKVVERLRCKPGRCTLCKRAIDTFKFTRDEPPQVLRESSARGARRPMLRVGD